MDKPLSSLAKRLISSAILIPIVVGIIWIGNWAFTGLTTICIAIAVAEWIKISKHMPLSALTRTMLVICGLLYLGISLLEIIHLRSLVDGFFWTLFFMLTIWASDSGAYLFGKTIGGPRMSPNISPNKTWAGYSGALLFPALVLCIGVHILTPDSLLENTPDTILTCVAGLLIGITGQSGDLMISAMKRKAGLKDTGALIPGHGGILDRIDALLLALPVYLAYLHFITG